MRKTLLALAFSAFAFVSAFAQYEDIYWKNVGSDNFVYASGGTANFYQGSPSNSPTMSNTYTIANNVATFGVNSSIGCTSSGTYQLAIVNDTLSFTVISDACFLRSYAVNNTRWTKYNPLGLEENAMSSLIKVYPNPAVGSFHIEMPAGNGRLALYDAKGMNVMEKSLNAMDNTISTESLNKGMYHAQIMVDGKWIKTATIVVQ